MKNKREPILDNILRRTHNIKSLYYSVWKNTKEKLSMFFKKGWHWNTESTEN